MSQQQVLEYARLRAAGETYAAIAARFGVTKQAVAQALARLEQRKPDAK